MKYPITPVPAPRMTKSDKWKKRPCVMRYFTFRDEIIKNGITIQESGTHIIFTMPMPNSWGAKKKKLWNGKAHQSKPDIDNLLKALFDAVFKDDSHIWDFRVTKVWGYKGEIEII